MMPDDRKYTKTHEWLKIEGLTAVVGISDYAQNALGDITFVELPAVGRDVKQAGECGVVESVKVASDLYAPVSGKVLKTNKALEDKPEIVNEDPYGKGWIYTLTDFNKAEVANLLSPAEYEAMLEKE